MFCSGAMFAQKAERKNVREGNKLYEAEKFTEAEIAYRKSLEVNPRSSEGTYNLGNALYKQKKFPEAAEQYQLIAGQGEKMIETPEGKARLAEIYHNVGNIGMQNKEYAKSVEAYKQSLRLNPKDDETRYNLALAQKLLQDQQNQQNEDQNQDQNEDKNEDQDKQDQQQQNQDQQQQQDDKKQDKTQEQQPQQQEQMSKDNAQQMLDAFLQDVYEPTDKEDRYHLIESSSMAGVEIKEGGKFAYSHHAKDPAYLKLCNAFDLVRIHKFGELDDKASFKAMCDFALTIDSVKVEALEERRRQAGEEFADGEDWRKSLELDRKGGIKDTLDNIVLIIQNDGELKGIAFNCHRDGIDAREGLPWEQIKGGWSDSDAAALKVYLSRNYGIYSPTKTKDAVVAVAAERAYHPIRDYLSALVWDGTERIRFCLRHFLGADADDYTYEALKLFLLGAISRAFQPGCKFEIMLCLVGGQGAGKSTFFRLLAVRDEWFSDDLRKLDDDNVYRKLQGHWIIEMSEMMATANAKSIEEIKSFLSRQKEVYKIPYETHPADRPRQCVFGGTSNALDFLPLDRSGNRRFIPVMVYPEQAEVHILEDETASRAYIGQMWAEAMEIYRSGRFKLAFSPAMQRYLKEHQRDFMPEDTKAGMIQAYLDKYTGSMVCSKQLYKEALNHAFDEPKQWEIREINEIMNQCISGWRYFPNPRMFSEYGRQKGWERENPATDSGNPSEKTMDGFVEVTEQMELPF